MEGELHRLGGATSYR